MTGVIYDENGLLVLWSLITDEDILISAMFYVYFFLLFIAIGVASFWYSSYRQENFGFKTSAQSTGSPKKNEEKKVNDNIHKIALKEDDSINKKSSVVISMKGLKNPGYICFINSIIQCLRYIPNFKTKCREQLNELLGQLDILSNHGTYRRDSDEHESETINLNKHSQSKRVDMIVQLLDLMNQLDSITSSSTIDPSSFIEAFSKICPFVVSNIRKQTQQDAEEFLSYLLNSIHETLNDNSNQCKDSMSSSMKAYEYIIEQCQNQLKSSNIRHPETYTAIVRLLSDTEWKKFQSKNQSFISTMFSGQMVRGSICMKCFELSCSHQEIRMLPLDVSKNSNHAITLKDCLSQFNQSEQLCNGNERFCNGICKENTPWETQLLLQRIPSILIIHFKRFEPNQSHHHTMRKCTQNIEFPIDHLNMTPFLFIRNVDEPFDYSLIGICCHIGPVLDSGHYISYVRDKEDLTTWIEYDDHNVNTMSKEEMIRKASSTVYLLFYQRID